MFLYIDLIIFFTFLALNTCLGVFAGKTTKTLADYALGDRKFSTGSIAGTLIATWIGAGFFLFSVSKIYTSGLPFIYIMTANGLMLMILSLFYIPRMQSFFGNLSIAGTMGSIYGKHVKIITAISAICLSIGYVGLQIKVLSNLVSCITQSGGIYIVLLCSIVVITYSAFGGIRAVVYTDVLQFFTFGVFIPIITFILWNSLNNTEVIYEVVSSKEFLDYDYLFSLNWLAIFIWFILPAMDPSIFQRVLMAKNTRQASKAFAIASVVCVTIIIFSAWLAILARATGKDLDPDNIINYILHNYSYKGLVGLTAAGIAAMVMSTADSYINSAAVLLSEDICTTFGIKLKNELFIAKIFAIITGVIGVFIALSDSSLFDITLTIANFYVPIVTAPITLAIFGFRSTTKSVLIGIFAGIITVIIWRTTLQDTGIDSVVPGLFANCIFLLGSHYLLKQDNGWIGIKDNEHLIMLRHNKKRFYRKSLIALKEFNLKNYLLSQAPKTDTTYFAFGTFALISTIISMYFLGNIANNNLIIFFYQSVLTISIMFITYPIWPATIKNTNIFAISWACISMYVLIIIGTYMLLISNFATIQLMTFTANLLVIAILFDWQLAIINCTIGIYIGAQIYIYQWGQIYAEKMGTMQFKILYVLLIISAALIAFAKAKQYKIKYLQKINKDLEKKYNTNTYELIRALHHREEFIDKFDQNCIQIVHQIGNDMNSCYNQLFAIKPDASSLHNIADQIKLIAARLNNGSDYLSCLINSLKQIKLHINSTDLNIMLRKLEEENVIVQTIFTTTPIICDHDKISYCFNMILDHAKNHANAEIIISVQNNFLEYDISFNNEYKDKIKAYTITFAISSDIITSQHIKNLLNPTLKNKTEMLFAKIADIIDAHYGRFTIETHDSVNVYYIITIPVDVKQVRPKVADLIYSSDLNINKLHKLLHYHEKNLFYI